MRSVASVKWSGCLAVATLLAASGYLMTLLTAPSTRAWAVAFDIYSFFYPVMIYAADAIRDGGHGLFWNPMQDCGQPFLGSGTTGVLYPPSIFFLVLDGDHALLALSFFNVAVGAIGTYLLCRELGLGRVAAVCGGLAFGCSNASVNLITFTPLLSSPYAWMPAALLCCERLLRTPTLGMSAALGVVLTVALVPGHPQVLLYIYQMLALRIVFEMARRRSWLGPRTLGFLFLGLVLPPLLGAVHLLPALELMRLSVRASSLSLVEIGSMLSWKGMLSQFSQRREIFNPFTIVPLMLVSASFCTTKHRREVIFYVALALISIDLAMGTNGHLFELYARLPLAGLFRSPPRYLWVVACCVAVLVAIGVEAIVSPETRSGNWLQRLGGFALPVGAVGLLRWSTPNVGTLGWEFVSISAVLAGSLLAVFVPRHRTVVALALTLALVLNLLILRPLPYRILLPNGSEVLYANADAFHWLKSRITAQDRTHIVGLHADYSLQQKTGSLFGIPALQDYQSLPTSRFAHYFTMLRTGVQMTNLNAYYYPLTGMLPPTIRRRLLDLAAVRYLVVDSTLHKATHTLSGPPLSFVYKTHRAPRPSTTTAATPQSPRPGRVDGSRGVRIYKNRAALRRARWVPRVEVVPDPAELLQRLSTGTDNLAHVALLELPPPSGFLGESGDATGTVSFIRNYPEDLILRIEAPQRGFLVLADQWFPGWRATVDGAPTAILRTNYLFRLVEVPAGRSTVQFRYVPDALRAGMLVSAITALALAFAVARNRRRNQQ